MNGDTKWDGPTCTEAAPPGTRLTTVLVASSSRPRPFGPRWSRMKSSCFDLAGIADGAYPFSELEETIDLTPRENLSNDTAIRTTRSERGIKAPPFHKRS